jgi:predicted permease
MADVPAGPQRAPRWLRWIAARVVRGRFADDVLADLDELFAADRASGMGGRHAAARYAKNAASSALRLLWDHGFSPGFSAVDVKLGVRMLFRQPMLTLVAVLALGLGIPAALSPAHAWLAIMAPLPFEEPDRIVGLRAWDIRANGVDPRILHEWDLWKELSSFSAVGVTRRDEWNVESADGRASPVAGAQMSAGAFDVLRQPPLQGRLLQPSDEMEGAPDVVVLGEDLWASRFGRDPDLVGRRVRIGGVPHTVVGIMPSDFRFPMREHFWVPFRLDPLRYPVGGGPALGVFARLTDGISTEEAQAELRTVGAAMAMEYPDTHETRLPEVVSTANWALNQRADAGSDPDILVGQALILVLLLIVCGNVGTMILARTATRVGEIAVRSALGASRTRIVGQLFVESMVLALVATGAGLVAAQFAARVFESFVEQTLPYWVDLGLNPRTVVTALGLAAVCALAAGVLPALKAVSSDIHANLQRTASGRTTVRFGVFSTLLIVSEVALSIGFLSFGGATMRGMLEDRSGAVGIELDDYLFAQLRLPWPEPVEPDEQAYADQFGAHVRDVQLEFERRLRDEPGVGHVALGRHLPGTVHPMQTLELEGVDGGGTSVVRAHHAVVDVDYFADLGVPIAAGRGFTSSDLEGRNASSRSAVLVNTSFVETMLGGRQAVGRRFRHMERGGRTGPWLEIVGVVGPLGVNALNPQHDWAVYHPAAPGELHPIGVIAEIGPGAGAFTPRLREIAAEVEPTLMVVDPQPVSRMVEWGRAAVSLGMSALILLASVAILLSVAGLYALMSFTVTQRTREIGIRTALGAPPREIVATIARRAGLQLLAGVVIGVAGSLWMFRELESDLLMPPDGRLTVLATIALGTLVVGSLACLRPTARGLSIQPTEALREN